MSEVTNDLIYEVLKSMQDRLGRIELRVDEVKQEIGAVRHYVLGIQQDVANIYARLGHLEDRVERVENRLGLSDAAH